MRCPDCNKFVSFEEQDPEVEALDIDSEGQVSGLVRIVNSCADCSTELTEATFDISNDHEDKVKGHTSGQHELSIEDDGSERCSRSGYFKKGQFVPAGGRYSKTFYGAVVNYTVRCSCGDLEFSDSITEDIQASSMETLT